MLAIIAEEDFHSMHSPEEFAFASRWRASLTHDVHSEGISVGTYERKKEFKNTQSLLLLARGLLGQRSASLQQILVADNTLNSMFCG